MKKIHFFGRIAFFLSSLILTVPSFASFYSNSPEKISYQALETAEKAYFNAKKDGLDVKKDIVTIIDYSLSSNKKRLWVIDLKNHKLLYNTFVSHGKYSGDILPNAFSNKEGSLKSSIGVYLTENTYIGHNGYSLVLNGLDKGYNNHAKARHIVMHGAQYVSGELAKKNGRVGRSFGCPAVEEKMAKPIIDTIKDGSIIVAYYPDKKWLKTSKFLENNA